MSRKKFLAVAGLLFGASGLHAQNINIPQIRNAPFVAISTMTTTDSKGAHQVAGKVARNSDGSSYAEMWRTDTNQLAEILIFDVPGKRFITLEVERKWYAIQEVPTLTARDLPPGSTAQQINQPQNMKPIHTEDNGLTRDIHPLGKLEIEGIVTVGYMETAHKSGPGPDARDYTAENWFSPELQIRLLDVSHDSLKGADQVSSLSHVQRVEPDAALFQIPADYQRDPINAQGAAAAQGSPK
jgi:hypothetical protein